MFDKADSFGAEPADVVSPKIEQAVLGTALVSWKSCSEHLDRLTEQHFSLAEHQQIFQIAQLQAAQGVTPTPMTVLTEIGDDGYSWQGLEPRAYLASLAKSCQHISNFPGYVEMLRRVTNKRRLQEIALELNQRACEPETLAVEDLEAVNGIIEAIRSDAAANTGKTNHQVGQRVSNLVRQQPKIYSTGLQTVDALMGCGLEAGRLYGFAGRPKSGKTNMLGGLAFALNEQGARTLYVAAEMFSEQILQREICHLMGMTGDVFRSRQIMDGVRDRTADAIDRTVAKIANNIIWEDRPRCRFEDLKAIISSHIYDNKIDAVVLDYWQLVQGRKERENEAQHLDNVAQWLAEIAKRHKLVVVTAAQINRVGETRGGDGLKMAADWYCDLNRVEGTEEHRAGVWLDVVMSRYTPADSAGDEDMPALVFHPYGPKFVEAGI